MRPSRTKMNIQKQHFYNKLDKVSNGLLLRYLTIIIGDFNLIIWKEDIYRPTIEKDSLHNDTNDNENKLITSAQLKIRL